MTASASTFVLNSMSYAYHTGIGLRHESLSGVVQTALLLFIWRVAHLSFFSCVI